DRIGAAAAVLRGYRVRRQPGTRGPREEIRRKRLPLVPFGGNRPELALRELVGELPQLALLVRRLERDQKVKSSMPPLTLSATPEAAERARHRRHVHDAAPAALLHVRPDGLRAVEGTRQVDAEVALPQLRILVR